MIWSEMFIFSLFSLIFIVMQMAAAKETVEVKLKQGILSGTVKTTLLKQQNYYSFTRVPYAAPPIDKLRFKPPAPHEGWEGTYEAHESKPTCLQFNIKKRMGETFGVSGSEDCLYLSVFTPNFEEPKAVVVFEYNDNFKTGFNDTNTYSPDFFIDENVVVVTISHRLGLFGYLTTEDEVIPGNNGLRDFIFGLKWIKENIENFGGDPKRVTLMGSRGGAVMANLLLYIHEAKDLFSSVIIQSGSAQETIFFHTNPKRVAYKLAELLNITATDSTTLLEEFRDIDGVRLLEKESDILEEEPIDTYQTTLFPFAPTIEPEVPGALLTTYPENNKIVNDVPVLMGFNSREGVDLALQYMMNPQIISEADNVFLFNFPVRSGYRFDTKSTVYENAMNEVREFYFKDGYLHHNNILEYAVYLGDILQNYPANYAGKLLAKDLESAVYFYMFDFYGMLNENTIFISRYSLTPLGNWGATIGDEICYLHVCTRIRKKYEQIINLVTEQREIKILKKMVRMWTNFAKSGNPTPSEDDDLLKGFTWKPISKDSYGTNYLNIAKKLEMKVNPLGDRKEFWDQFLKKYAEMVVDGVVESVKSHQEL